MNVVLLLAHLASGCIGGWTAAAGATWLVELGNRRGHHRTPRQEPRE